MQELETKYLKSIRLNIKKLREEKAYSQEELAEKIDRSREFINKIENGKLNLSLKTLIRLLIVFNVSPNSIFDYK